MLLRFKEQHCIDPSNRICYETVTDEAIWDYDEESRQWVLCYDLKLLGLTPSDYLEEAEGNEKAAIDVYIKTQKK